MPKKILCAVDGSHEADRAAACAADLAKDTGAKLTLLHVNPIPADRIAKTYFWDEVLLGAVERQIHQQIGNAAKVVAARGGADFDTVVVSGNRVSSAINSYAEEKGYDHIVIATGISNELERIILGSVATDVISKAHCPVTVVR
ncbi:universal stress protein [Dongia soli]|uniref:Universal stress protein n=1 Tax=Dongia soli TaxID=600628 RepID=A0ABU5E6P9_9PROT|nr:universal stress protein [Dongia soli]MDY0881858.1 universal stress protein [Dongia soli]